MLNWPSPACMPRPASTHSRYVYTTISMGQIQHCHLTSKQRCYQKPRPAAPRVPWVVSLQCAMLAKCYLTSMFKWEMIYSTLNGHWPSYFISSNKKEKLLNKKLCWAVAVVRLHDDWEIMGSVLWIDQFHVYKKMTSYFCRKTPKKSLYEATWARIELRRKPNKLVKHGIREN